jgi:hypothetical protein
MRPRQGSRVRHAEQWWRGGHIARLHELWDAAAGCWEPAAEVQWDDGTASPWPLRELVLVRRGEREESEGRA